MKPFTKILLYSIVFLLAFFSFGYILSDDVFYKRIVRDHHLDTPFKVYTYVITGHKKKTRETLHPNATPRHLMEKHQSLWCDEGAIVMATLDNELGYRTRLADLVGVDGISHHTILQVLENGQWVNCDFTFRLYNQPVSVSASKGRMFLKRIRIKKYPGGYNFVINNNFFMKKAALFLRGIDEDIPEAD